MPGYAGSKSPASRTPPRARTKKTLRAARRAHSHGTSTAPSQSRAAPYTVRAWNLRDPIWTVLGPLAMLLSQLLRKGCARIDQHKRGAAHSCVAVCVAGCTACPHTMDVAAQIAHSNTPDPSRQPAAHWPCLLCDHTAAFPKRHLLLRWSQLQPFEQLLVPSRVKPYQRPQHKELQNSLAQVGTIPCSKAVDDDLREETNPQPWRPDWHRKGALLSEHLLLLILA